MRKIPTLFARDFGHDPRYVTRDVTPGCEWVLKGEGTPTRKYDGTCVMFDGTEWWARREVKKDRLPPPSFREVEHNDETGKTVGWEPIGQSAFARWHAEAIEGIAVQPPGTYELLGPKINDDPERMGHHCIWAHVLAEQVDLPVRDYDTIEAFLAGTHIEGIVWHHPDGRMAKIKKRDFPAPTAAPAPAPEPT